MRFVSFISMVGRVVLLGLAGGLGVRAASGPVAPSDLPAGAARVEIIEGLPDQLSWQFTNGLPTVAEQYEEPVLGLVVAPTKYSSRGVKVDRKAPFLVRGSARVALPEGELRLLLRARTGARLWVDGRLVLSTRFLNLNGDGHEEVPELPVAATPDIRLLQPGQLESLTNWVSDGRPHIFVVEALIGLKGRRPELGELSVSWSRGGEDSFRVVGPGRGVLLTEAGWAAHEVERRGFWAEQDRQRRAAASAGELAYWRHRHEEARRAVGGAPAVPDADTIDRVVEARWRTAGVALPPLTDDHAFLRRLALDVTGTIPTPAQLAAFLQDRSPDRRARAVDRFLAEPGWADHWVGYWQDVLAENPGILKPMLNNTGPFRWWLHEAFTDNTPMDRFATELILMEGSIHYGGPAGFSLATENDVPMAQKAQIVAQSFLGLQLQCARCHDAPYHDFKQEQLFALAAMLKRGKQAVPASSSIPTNANIVLGRKVQVTLPPGSEVAPRWPFPELVPDAVPEGVLRDPADPRERLAALITGPRNERFAKVLVNRLWQRYLGWGLVEPVDDWDAAAEGPSHPELLDRLARELVSHGYDLRHVARLILNSRTYQRAVRPERPADRPGAGRLWAAPARRRMTAEQLLDSLFVAAGKNFRSEEMNLDVDGRRPVKDFNNLGRPERAWEFASLSNERDRPALAMPRAQQLIDCLCTFGWRDSRQSPQTLRDHAANVLQPAALANGLVTHGRIARLSDDSALTALALEDRPLGALVDALFLRVLSRPPAAAERAAFMAQLAEGYEGRRLPPSGSQARDRRGGERAVSWSNHLNPEATRLKQEAERAARAGDPSTERLRADWRERMEDAVWSLVNSPEFLFVP